MNPEEATRQCIEALRHGAVSYNDKQALATALESGDLHIVDADLLRTLQAAGVLHRIINKDGSHLAASRFCHRLIDKVATGIETIVDKKRLAALEKVVAKADGLMKLDTATMKARTTWTEMQDALAELDALNGD